MKVKFAFHLLKSHDRCIQVYLQCSLIKKGDELSSQQHNHFFSQEFWYKNSRQNKVTGKPNFENFDMPFFKSYNKY